MYQWQHTQIIDEMSHHECQIKIFNPLLYQNPEEANEKLRIEIKKEPYDLFMTVHNHKDLFISTLKDIKSMGIPTLLICFDNLQVPFMHFKIASYFDLVWLTSKETKRLFEKRKCNTIFLPYAANPYLKRLGKKTIAGIGFVGTPYGSRANIINNLTKSNIHVYCHCLKNDNSSVINYAYNSVKKSNKLITAYQMLKFSEGRKILQGYCVNKYRKESMLVNRDFLHKETIVHPKDIYMTYEKYTLALSVNTAANTDVLKNPLSILNLRCFEIPMSGGVEFCKYVPELSEYFEEDKEIIFYRNKQEIIEKAKFYLSEKYCDLRDQIGHNARYRAEQEHTWFHRFSEIFKKIGIN